MNAIPVVVAIVVISATTYVVFKTQQKITVLKDRNQLYAEFMKRTSVKSFLQAMNRMDSKVINQDIILMLEKYFEYVLMRLEHEAVPQILDDISMSKHSDVLRKAFVKAVKGDDIIFGLALAEYINHPQKKSNIELFLAHLPQWETKRQYEIALEILETVYITRIIDYPAEHRKTAEESIRNLKQKITQIS